MRARFRPFSRWLSVLPPEAERLTVVAKDGLRLNVLRVRQPGVQGKPVLLVHGLAGSTIAFHFPERSLATYLAQRGFDCFVPDLRGAGQSELPFGGWDIHDHLTHDLPALIEAVLEHSGERELGYVGHSMGGILGLSHTALTGDQRIGRIVAVASALDYRVGDSRFRRILGLKGIVSRLRLNLPYGELLHLASPLFGRGGFELDNFHAWPSNIEPHMLRRLYACAFDTIPTTLLVSLSALFEEAGLLSKDGVHSVRERAAAIATPTLMLAGSQDRQCPAPAVLATTAIIPGARAVTFGKHNGTADDYGHFDLLIGKRAEHEVWPKIASFLLED